MASPAPLHHVFDIQISSVHAEPAKVQQAALVLGPDVEFVGVAPTEAAVDVPPAERRPRRLTATFRYPAGVGDERAAAAAIRRQMAAAGITTIRTKIETDFSAPADARYFEQHVRIVIDAGDVGDPLARIAAAHGARVTCAPAPGRERLAAERCLTQRWWELSDLAGAESRFDQLVGELERRSMTIVSVVRERVVHDTNLQLDA